MTPRLFELRLPPLELERGGVLAPHHARGWWWGPSPGPAIARLALDVPARPLRVVRRERPLEPLAVPPLGAEVPTVLLVHALTGDAMAGGEGGWWSPVIGPGRPLDPTRYQLLCFNNLGGCYGSSGPLDEGFPAAAELTTVDQARALWAALDALGVQRLHLVAGGSLGGMIALALAALRPRAVERLMPIGASAASSAWVVGFNHVQRAALELDPAHGLSLARQVAMLTYRAEPGLDAVQGRTLPRQAGAPGRFRVEGYLAHQGKRLVERFHAASYRVLLDAMDLHDLVHGPVRLASVRASSLVVDIDTDQLFTPAQVDALGAHLAAAGAHVERATLRSLHGHDGFLIEWAALAPLVARALALPAPSPPGRDA